MAISDHETLFGQGALRDGAGSYGSNAPETLPVAALGLLLLRRTRLIAAVAICFAVAAIVALLLQGRRFTADSSFVLQGKLNRSGLSGIAAQFGLAVPASDASDSPEFFVKLARTRPVLNAIADSAPNVLGGMSLETLFDVKKGSVAHRRTDALKAFDKALGTAVQSKTGIVDLTLTTHDPNASANLLALLVRTIDRFNRASQQEQAGAQRRFSEERVNATEKDLRAAEDRLQSFLSNNRVVGSPILQLNQDRLQREVQAAQALHSTLQQAMETARIEELRNTPVITLLEAAVAPLDPDSRHIAQYALVAAIFGTLMASMFVLLTGVRTVRGLTAEQAHMAFNQQLRALWSRKPAR